MGAANRRPGFWQHSCTGPARCRLPGRSCGGWFGGLCRPVFIVYTYIYNIKGNTDRPRRHPHGVSRRTPFPPFADPDQQKGNGCRGIKEAASFKRDIMESAAHRFPLYVSPPGQLAHAMQSTACRKATLAGNIKPGGEHQTWRGTPNISGNTKCGGLHVGCLAGDHGAGQVFAPAPRRCLRKGGSIVNAMESYTFQPCKNLIHQLLHG